MSQVTISGNAGGTGIFTIASPATNTNRTLTLPDATGTIAISGGAVSGTTGSFSSDLSFNSGYGSAAVAYGCRAWVNFNGTGTVAIRSSGNVSSITDNGLGDYTVNFTTAMPDANYAYFVYARDSGGSNNILMSRNTGAAPTTSAFRFVITNAAAINTDLDMINAAIFR